MFSAPDFDHSTVKQVTNIVLSVYHIQKVLLIFERKKFLIRFLLKSYSVMKQRSYVSLLDLELHPIACNASDIENIAFS